ncbi:hypothetical protein [Streptomyces flaveolus]|uniref:hypothetical protein n=1 Tax=Streptomyces flaveolus TaxID=67297 RepID=UPI0036FFBDF2
MLDHGHADPASTPAGEFTTGGAGGGTTRRTLWATGYDGRLAVTVALFADRTGGMNGTTVPAHLLNQPSPADFTQSVANGIWEAGTKDNAEHDAKDGTGQTPLPPAAIPTPTSVSDSGRR